MATYGISTANGMENLIDSDRPIEVVLAKGYADFDRTPIYNYTDYGCGLPLYSMGTPHVPVEVTLKKNFRGQTYLGSFPSRPYFYLFENCTLVAGCSLGNSVGLYGGANHSNVVTPCGFSRAVWSETDDEITVKYFGVWSGTETSWRSTARMTGRVYVMLIGELPPDANQELPDFGITMHDSAGARTTFNSNYEPSNPRHFAPRPPYDISNYRTNTAFTGDMGGGIKMTTVAPVAYCRWSPSSSQNRYKHVWPCFSRDGRRIGTRSQGWNDADNHPPGWNPRTHIMPADHLLRVWNVADYFDTPKREITIGWQDRPSNDRYGCSYLDSLGDRFGSILNNRTYRGANITALYTTSAPTNSSHIRFDVNPNNIDDIVMTVDGNSYTFTQSNVDPLVFICSDTIWLTPEIGNSYDITFADE